jgi:hypothetical protein
MLALAYLERRFVAHQLGAIWRSPVRLAIWIPYAISIAYLALVRGLGQSGAMFDSMHLDGEHLTSLGGLYLAALGTTIALSAGGRVSGFRSSAEAVLFSNSGIRPLEMAVWLQLRKLFSSGLRWIGALTYYFLIFFPHHHSPVRGTIAFAAALLAVVLLLSIELPIFLLSRGSFNFWFRAVGWLLALGGLGYVVVGFAGAHVWSAAIALVRCDPGRAVSSVQNGSTNALTLIASLLGVMLIAIALLGSDSLPELNAVSRRSLAELRRRQSAIRQTRYAAVVSTPASHIPLGALSLAWKDWIGFRRGHGSLAMWGGGCAFWAACGAGLAYASITFDDTSPLLALFGASGLMLLFIAPHGAAAGLAGDLGKPLFWLAADGLRSRLAAWTLGRALRGGVALGLAPLAAAAVFHRPLLALLAIPLCFAAYWSLQSLGIGLFAFFPNPIDARGPMAIVRTLLTFAYIVPAIVLGGIAAAAGAGTLGAFVAACMVFAAEGYAAIELSSRRLREAGAATALAASA